LNGITLDAGGLIALERSDRRVWSILDTALEDGDRIVVPATALAQVIRNPAVGALLARTGTSDITDAHVVVCAQARGHAVVTSDPLDITRLNPKLRVIAV
jgi:predicted nucleic acid-binding protein